jgi:hypothetical protein
MRPQFRGSGGRSDTDETAQDRADRSITGSLVDSKVVPLLALSNARSRLPTERYIDSNSSPTNAFRQRIRAIMGSRVACGSMSGSHWCSSLSQRLSAGISMPDSCGPPSAVHGHEQPVTNDRF